MKTTLGKLFGIQPSEWEAVLYFFFVVLSFSFGSSIARSIGMTLLVEHLGSASLPQMFIIIDTLAFLGFLGYSHYTKKISELPILSFLLLFGAVFSIGMQILLTFNMDWIYGAFFVGFFLVYVFLSIHLSSVLGAYFSAVQLKRLTGFINAGLPIGGALGGISLYLLLQFVPPQWLVILMGITYILAFLLLRRIALVLSPIRSSRGTFKDNRPILKELHNTFNYILHSPLLIYMAIGTFFFVFGVKLLEYQYQGIIYPSEYPNATQRAQFFAAYDIFANLAWLSLQLFLTSRIIVKLGVGASNLLHPLMTAGVSLMLMLNFSFVPGIVAQFVNQEMRLAMRTPANNLLFNAIPPNLWGTTKAFINGVIFPLGTLLGSFTLILLEAQYPKDDLIFLLPAITLLLAVLGLLAGFPLWFAYNRGVFGLLNQTLLPQNVGANVGKRPELQAALKIQLASDDTQNVIAALGMIRILGYQHFVHAVGKLLHHSKNLLIKQECIDTLAALPQSEVTVTYLLKALKSERDPHTLALIIQDMRSFSLYLPEVLPVVEKLLLYPHPDVFVQSCLYLHSNPHYRQQSIIEDRLLRRLEHPELPRFALYLYAVGELGNGSYGYRVKPFMDSPQQDIQVAAFKAYVKLLGNNLQPYMQQLLHALEFSTAKEIKITALKALQQCQPPEDWRPVVGLLASKDRQVFNEAVELLRLRLNSCRPALIEEVFRRDIPVEEKFEVLTLVYPRFTQQQQRRLHDDGKELLKHFLRLRTVKYLYQTLSQPSARTDLLLKIVDEITEDVLRHVLTVITYLNNEDLEFFQRVSSGLLSKNKANQGNALEVLSNVSEKELSQKVLHYFEVLPNALEGYAQLYVSLFEQELTIHRGNAMQYLMDLNNPLLRACLLYEQHRQYPGSHTYQQEAPETLAFLGLQPS